MYRKIEEELKRWKESPYRKPLVLQGPGQAGKTWTLLEFGKREYESAAYFNFETHPQKERLKEIFNTSISPSVLIPALSDLIGQPILKEKTLIILDEVQYCDQALTSLKYFCEEAPQYHVAAAGALLCVAVNREPFSYPVGKINTKTLNPMDFEEFLLAMGESELIKTIKQCFETSTPMKEPWHQRALSLYQTYLAIGGMPACIKLYRETKNEALVRNRQIEILKTYLSDMSQYNNELQTRITRDLYIQLGTWLCQKKSRFDQERLKETVGTEKLEEALDWLTLSGLINPVTEVKQARKPLYANQDFSSYRLYYSDTALLAAASGLPFHELSKMSPDLNDFKEATAENYVNFHLRNNGYAPYFWQAKKEAEVDFIIEKEGKIIPVEVKIFGQVQNQKSDSLYGYLSS